MDGPGFSLALVVASPFLASPVEFSLGLSQPTSALPFSVFLFCLWSLDLCLNLFVLRPLSWWSLKSCLLKEASFLEPSPSPGPLTGDLARASGALSGGWKSHWCLMSNLTRSGGGLGGVFCFVFFFISGVMRSPFLLSALRSSGHILGHFQGGLGHDVFWTLRNVSGAFTAVMKFTYTSQYKVALPFILLRMEQ